MAGVFDASPGTNLPAAFPEDVDLDAFEALVYRRQCEEAVRTLHVVLNRLKRGREFAGHPPNDERRRVLYSRLAAAIGALLCDPLFTLSQDGFDILAVEHATFSAIFRASVFGNSDHLLCQFGTYDPGYPDKLQIATPEGIGRLLMLYSLDSRFELDFEQAIRFDPRRALPVFLGMLAAHVVLTPAHHERRERLLKLGYLFEQAAITGQMLIAMADAYMYCSYAESETKHQIKKTFNLLASRLIESRIDLLAFSGERELKSRPTMLVPIELFTSQHAMYRCYAPVISQLRKRFRLVLIGGGSEMDEITRQLFDDVIVLEQGATGYPELVSRIGSLGPDIIYYPSLGMSPHWVALSSVRLAPIQLITLGHPATTFSEAIDYALVAEGMPGDPETLRETVMVVSGTPGMVHRSDADFPEPAIRERPDVLRIAVPSTVMKLNAPFLAVCSDLAKRSNRELEFHFFPAISGLFHHVARLEILCWLPEAVVYRSSGYNEYLRNLRKCDIRLGTFPFGGHNSNIDTLKLCIPMVTLEGKEVHGQTDAGMMRAMGMSDWLIAHDEAEYVRAALRLIESDADRIEIARKLRDVDVDAIFGEESGVAHSVDFANAVWFAYTNHEAIQRSGRRYWTVAERCGFRGDTASGEDVIRNP